MELAELGFYTLAGHSDGPRDIVDEVATPSRSGSAPRFVVRAVQRQGRRDPLGRHGAVSEEIGVATAATNHNTRHPMVLATFATTMHRLSGGRFALGLGRGFDRLFMGMGLAPITSAQLEDAADVLRRLWRGEMILGHDGPLGSFPYLFQDADFDEDIPLLLVAIGEKTLELAGRCMDAVVLHTFFGDEALVNSVAAVRRGAEQAGRDPATVRVWSVLATVGDHIDEATRLKKTVGRMASYLQGYGDLLVQVNGWDPAVLERFRADAFVQGFQGAFDAKATTSELEYLATLLPEEWTASAATGTPEQCAATVVRQLDLGADSVILHGATPAELAPILPAYRTVRPAGLRAMPANPGRSPS